MGTEKTEDGIEAVAPVYTGDGSDQGDLKSVTSDDALLMSMGKEPELKR
jgi:hypothetical protein